MELTATLPTEALWQNALGAVPLALVAALICRFVPCRPATRHTLWVVVLLTFLVPPLLPDVPRPDVRSMAVAAVDFVAGAFGKEEPVGSALTTAGSGESVQQDGMPDWAGTARDLRPVTWHSPQRSRADAVFEPCVPLLRSLARTEPHVPQRLARARGSVERLLSRRTRSVCACAQCQPCFDPPTAEPVALARPVVSSRQPRCGQRPQKSACDQPYRRCRTPERESRSSLDGLGGKVWRSQAVVLRDLHGLPTASVDRATHQNAPDRALVTSARAQALGSSMPAAALPRGCFR